MSRIRKGKREYLNDSQTKDLIKRLNEYFELKVEIPRIRVGEKQTIETLINEETLLISKYLREEIKSWAPRVTSHTLLIPRKYVLPFGIPVN